MADHQIGNKHGFAAVGKQDALLATVTADGVNTVTVDDVTGLYPGMVIDIVNISTGAELAVDRTITNITSGKVVTYDGADVTATTAHGIYLANTYGDGPSYANQNGGIGDREGFNLDDLDTIAAMRARLTAIDGTYYTATVLNMMTTNDMAYAIRLNDARSSVGIV